MPLAALMASLGAGSALAEATASPEECAVMHTEAQRMRKEGLEWEAHRIEQLAGILCVCSNEAPALLSCAGDCDRSPLA